MDKKTTETVREAYQFLKTLKLFVKMELVPMNDLLKMSQKLAKRLERILPPEEDLCHAAPNADTK